MEKLEHKPDSEKSDGELDKSVLDHNLTISTKLSTDQLICKSPHDSPISSRSTEENKVNAFGDGESGNYEYLNKRNAAVAVRCRAHILVYLGLLQLLLGLLMIVFGVLVLKSDAALSQTCGGIWGGLVVIISGMLAISSTARDCCPLRPRLAKLALNGHFAFNLISLAMANLVLVFSAIGIFRDLNRSDMMPPEVQNETEVSSTMLPFNYKNCAAILANIGLLASCSIECIVAIIAAWKCSHLLCACFQIPDDNLSVETKSAFKSSSVILAGHKGNSKDVLVSAWLGNQHQQLPGRISSTMPRLGNTVAVEKGAYSVYLVSTAPRPRKKQLIPAPLRPLSVPPPRPMMSYPIVRGSPPSGHHPASLPRSINYSNHQMPYNMPVHNVHPYSRSKNLPTNHRMTSTLPNPMQLENNVRKDKRKKKQQKGGLTDAEVVQSYTGLDRAIAEEFIDQCNSNRKPLQRSKSMDLQSSPDSSIIVTDNTSKDVLVEKL